MILLDTHALIWLDQDDSKLGKTARKRIDTALSEGRLAVSSITFWETAMLTARSRIRMSLPVMQWRRDLLGAGLQEVAIDGEVAVTAGMLDIDHGDPADRFIVSTALLTGATLVTADQKLLGWRSPVKMIDARQ